jgi:protease secretion system membrane fusion protein
MNPLTLFKKLVDAIFARLGNWAKTFNPYVPEDLAKDGIEPVRIEESQVKKQAGKVVFFTFVIFLIWAVTAPMDSGIAVSGTVVVLGSRKAVQHPTGGVVDEILIREGDQVQQGDVLIRINPLNLDANLRQSEYEFINAAAVYSRLLAERTETANITWDTDLREFGQNEQVAEAKRLQTAFFRSRRAELSDQRAIMQGQAQGLLQQIAAQETVLQFRLTQLAPLVEDAKSMRKLADDGFVPRSKANEAERSGSEAQAGIANLRSQIASIRTALASNQLEVSKLKAAFTKDVDAQLTETQKIRETVRSKVLSLRFDQSLASVRATAAGTIVGLKVHTVGGVITAGQLLMEIVPPDLGLIAEVAVPPYLIDKVQVGLLADMRFSAFNSTTTPVVPGIVRLIGADRLPPSPPKFPEEYYLMQVETTKEARETLAENTILAGMPVEVIVKSGERTFMSYMLKPLKDRFARSFKQ